MFSVSSCLCPPARSPMSWLCFKGALMGRPPRSPARPDTAGSLHVGVQPHAAESAMSCVISSTTSQSSFCALPLRTSCAQKRFTERLLALEALRHPAAARPPRGRDEAVGSSRAPRRRRSGPNNGHLRQVARRRVQNAHAALKADTHGNRFRQDCLAS